MSTFTPTVIDEVYSRKALRAMCDELKLEYKGGDKADELREQVKKEASKSKRWPTVTHDIIKSMIRCDALKELCTSMGLDEESIERCTSKKDYWRLLEEEFKMKFWKSVRVMIPKGFAYAYVVPFEEVKVNGSTSHVVVKAGITQSGGQLAKRMHTEACGLRNIGAKDNMLVTIAQGHSDKDAIRAMQKSNSWKKNVLYLFRTAHAAAYEKWLRGWLGAPIGQAAFKVVTKKGRTDTPDLQMESKGAGKWKEFCRARNYSIGPTEFVLVDIGTVKAVQDRFGLNMNVDEHDDVFFAHLLDICCTKERKGRSRLGPSDVIQIKRPGTLGSTGSTTYTTFTLKEEWDSSDTGTPVAP